MKRNPVLITLVAATCLVLGCVTIATPTEPPTSTSPDIPTKSVPSLPPTSTSMPQPTETPVQQAPVCTADPLAGACSVPEVGTLSKFCVKKIPYTLIGIPPASTFQPMDPALVCKDEKVWNGVREISCTGQQLYSYKIKVCDANCSASPLVTGNGKCAEGYGYSEVGNCCWATTNLDAGCVIYQVDIGGCQ